MSNNTIEINNIIEVEQPLGTFLVVKMSPEDLLCISCPDARSYNPELEEYIGIQRDIKQSKVRGIKEFINTADATIPNTIIGVLSQDYYTYDRDNNKLYILKDENAFKIIDGQHRLKAFDGTLHLQGKFELVVTIFLDADISDQSYIFSIINTTQSKLDTSLVQDLTELSKITTPENIVHAIAKVFNTETDSPWYQHIKMLGKKDQTSVNGIISQYSFNKSILRYIYSRKDINKIRDILIKNNDNREKLKNLDIDTKKYIFWNYYLNNQENIIYKILKTYFSALKEVFLDKWCSPDSIMCKTSGYDAFMRLFEDFYNYADEDKINTLTNLDFYKNILNNFKAVDIDADANKLGSAGAANLYKILKEIFPKKENS